MLRTIFAPFWAKKFFDSPTQSNPTEPSILENLALSASRKKNRLSRKVQEKKLWRFENFHFSDKNWNYRIFFYYTLSMSESVSEVPKSHMSVSESASDMDSDMNSCPNSCPCPFISASRLFIENSCLLSKHDPKIRLPRSVLLHHQPVT